jgi:hypothetical protein
VSTSLTCLHLETASTHRISESCPLKSGTEHSESHLVHVQLTVHLGEQNWQQETTAVFFERYFNGFAVDFEFSSNQAFQIRHGFRMSYALNVVAHEGKRLKLGFESRNRGEGFARFWWN